MQPDQHMTDAEPTDNTARQRWMGVLARAATGQLEQALASLDEAPAFEHIRPPEVGMALVRARADGNGQRFNLGEMTLTRCSVRTDSGIVGHGYVSGRDKRHAELAAYVDALLQSPELAETVEREIIAPLAEEQRKSRQESAARTAATQVSFFTMVRGENKD